MLNEKDETILQDIIENGADEDEIATYKAVTEEGNDGLDTFELDELIHRDIEAMKNGELPREFFWSPYGPTPYTTEMINSPDDIDAIVRLAGQITLYKHGYKEDGCSFNWENLEEREACEKIICSDAYLNFLREVIEEIKIKENESSEPESSRFSPSMPDEEIPF